MSLNETDFARLKLTTKIIKTILKIQKQLSDDQVIEEEYLETQETPETPNEEAETATEANNQPTPGSSDVHNPYHGITLEHVSLDPKFTCFELVHKSVFDICSLR